MGHIERNPTGVQLVIAFCVALEFKWIQAVSNQLNLQSKCETICNEEYFIWLVDGNQIKPRPLQMKKKKTTLGSRPIIGGSIFPVVEYVTSGDGMNVLRSDSVAETNTKSYLPLKIFCV